MSSPNHAHLQRRLSDYERKIINVQQMLELNKLDGILITQVHNFAWITCGGRSYIPLNTQMGVASIYIDKENVLLITNNIESQRLLNEELQGLPIELYSKSWWNMPSYKDILEEIARGKRTVLDTDSCIASALGKLRSRLSDYEKDLYRELGKDCGEIIGETCHAIKPGMTEWEVASSLSGNCQLKAIDAVVVLIAGDERMETVRHPLPTHKVITKKVMVVLCGRRHGLICSLTRIVHFGPIPYDLQQRHDAVTYVDAVAMTSTYENQTSTNVLIAIQKAYKQKGFEDEWRLHHQGGCAGYLGREWKADARNNEHIMLNQAFAWNPSISGTKSEDTMLLTSKGIEIISNSPNWPMLSVKIDGKLIDRPNILEL